MQELSILNESVTIAVYGRLDKLLRQRIYRPAILYTSVHSQSDKHLAFNENRSILGQRTGVFWDTCVRKLLVAED